MPLPLQRNEKTAQALWNNGTCAVDCLYALSYNRERMQVDLCIRHGGLLYLF